ncbi:hypothetical protein TCAL_14900 [Tigriopus californicus]|uniref:Uncharacterized protein n=1 Tax=Tigriopus californicus TaxID=6832 RepID=A0A553P423_TIGCA|nr:hypothetical protein TCAL_14900 [Tigriopus californicus]
MSTLSGHKHSKEGRILDGLVVKGVNEEASFSFPPAFKNEMIPNTKGEVATPTMVKAHRHVAHLAQHLNDIDATVPVLIFSGRDAGDALSTKQYGKHVPYSHHTALGWWVQCAPLQSVDQACNSKRYVQM